MHSNRKPWRKLYGRRWREARALHLAREPLCRFCLKKGATVVARVVDHIAPHRGDQALFWQQSNWQSLCFACHNSAKQRVESFDTKVAGIRSCGADGYTTGSEW